MKILLGKVCIVAWALFQFVTAPPGAAWGGGPEWVKVDRNEESTFSYDKSGISTPREGMIRVTTRVEYTEKGKAQTRAALKSAAEYEKLSESRFVIDINCRQQKSHLLLITHYDGAGKEIKAFDLGGMTDWEDIPHDARMEQVAASECRR